SDSQSIFPRRPYRQMISPNLVNFSPNLRTSRSPKLLSPRLLWLCPTSPPLRFSNRLWRRRTRPWQASMGRHDMSMSETDSIHNGIEDAAAPAAASKSANSGAAQHPGETAGQADNHVSETLKAAQSY